MKHAEPKKGVDKRLIVLGAVTGFLLLKRIFSKKPKPGLYEGLGKKVDQGLGGLANKFGSDKK